MKKQVINHVILYVLNHVIKQNLPDNNKEIYFEYFNE